MKLLVLTQKIDKNDDLLGFFSSWIIEFAKRCEKITVVCLYQGEYDLPDNVEVFSLGKEKIADGKSEISKRLIYTKNFFRLIWEKRGDYDAVFVHMNVIYVLLGTWLWRLLGKKIGLWHAHGKTRWNLRLAAHLVDHIFTSTKEGCRMESDKIRIVGQGIDVARFVPKSKSPTDVLTLVSVGRLSPVKDYETIIQALASINRARKTRLQIVGGVGLAGQESYVDELKKMVTELSLDGSVDFVGALPNMHIINRLQEADVFVNASHTGSLDKAMLEAMACGLPVFTCNEAIFETLGEYCQSLAFEKKNHEELAKQIIAWCALDSETKLKMSLRMREIVEHEHNVATLTEKILGYYGDEK